MSLLKLIGQAYVHLSSYECKQALNVFSSLAPHHYNTGWVLTQVGRAHFELAEYQLVKYYLKSIKYFCSKCMMWLDKPQLKLREDLSDIIHIPQFSKLCVLGKLYEAQYTQCSDICPWT